MTRPSTDRISYLLEFDFHTFMRGNVTYCNYTARRLSIVEADITTSRIIALIKTKNRSNRSIAPVSQVRHLLKSATKTYVGDVRSGKNL
jgi:hypothetical protein